MDKKGDIQRREDGVEYVKEAICATAEECRRASPITYIDDLKADVMIIHGVIDQRVPVAHAEVLRDALDERGVSYEWLVKRKEGHGFVNVDNREELYQRLLAFLDRNIGSQAET
jgi:acylaminoacyl-peptidase